MRTVPACRSARNSSKSFLRLSPWDSIALRSAIGLVRRKSGGRCRSLGDRPGVSRSASSIWRVKKRYHCLARSEGTSFDHTGSEKRVSSGCGRTKSAPPRPARRAAVCICKVRNSEQNFSQRSENSWGVQQPREIRVRQRREHAKRVEHRLGIVLERLQVLCVERQRSRDTLLGAGLLGRRRHRGRRYPVQGASVRPDARAGVEARKP